MSEKNLNEKRSSRVTVLEAIHRLSDLEMPITNDSIVRQTGLKTVTVADCLKELKERDEITSIERGVYRPLHKHPPSQVIYFASMPDGRTRIEKGDSVIEFTPHEMSHQVSPKLAGYVAQFMAVENAHQVMYLVEQDRRKDRRIAALEAKLKLNPNQGSLPL